MAPLATDPDEKHLSPLEGAMIKGHMEVWDILKDHIEMTVELKLEQLFYMIVTREYRNREECRTKFRELLSSIPVESVTWTSKGDPPVTRTLLQASYTPTPVWAIPSLTFHKFPHRLQPSMGTRRQFRSCLNMGGCLIFHGINRNS